MTHMKPSPAMVVAFVALIVSVTSGAYAAVRITTSDLANGAVTNPKLAHNSVWHANIGTRSVRSNNLNNGAVRNAQLARNSVWHANIGTGSVRSNNLADGAVGHSQLAHNSVWHSNIGNGSVQRNNVSQQLLSELKGSAGPAGPAGPAGANGANPGVPVVHVPAVTSGETGAGGPNSGQAGDQGFYLTGVGADGPARLAGGQLVLHGVGVDTNTPQGAIGIAKAFSNVPLGTLDALSYTWHVNTLHGTQAPGIHITATGVTVPATRFPASGFANLVYSPGLNNVTVGASQQFQSDGFAAGARWFSTGATNINAPGGQNDPQPLSFFADNNPNAVIVQISLNNGGSSGATGSFEAGADDLILGFTGSRFTRYDFDA
jgi:hypothetical protein